MIKPFFETDERKLALVQEAATWIGTPFFPHGKVKGGGVDCVQLAAQIYIATGFLDTFEPGAYSMDGGRHSDCSKVLEWIEKSGKFDAMIVCESLSLEIGDLLSFVVHRSKVAWHVGVYLGDGMFIHSMLNRTVAVGDLNNLQAIRLFAIHRPMEVRS